jgi:hypothetical protein
MCVCVFRQRCDYYAFKTTTKNIRHRHLLFGYTNILVVKKNQTKYKNDERKSNFFLFKDRLTHASNVKIIIGFQADQDLIS